MSADTLYMTMIFDFFGDLLTEKQREYFDLYHNDDLSLSEIAEKAGISRQGVYDIITRAEKTLTDIERKTGIVKKWRETRDSIKQAGDISLKLTDLSESGSESAKLLKELIRILDGLISDL